MQTTLKYDIEVNQKGLTISEQAIDNDDELLAATQTRLDFWDNPFDDEDWNLV